MTTPGPLTGPLSWPVRVAQRARRSPSGPSTIFRRFPSTPLACDDWVARRAPGASLPTPSRSWCGSRRVPRSRRRTASGMSARRSRTDNPPVRAVHKPAKPAVRRCRGPSPGPRRPPGRTLALPLGLHAPQVVVDLVLEPRRVPAGRPRHRLCGGTRCLHAPVEGLDGDPGAPGEHVVEVPGTVRPRRPPPRAGSPRRPPAARRGRARRRPAPAPRPPGRRTGRAGGRCAGCSRAACASAARWFTRVSKPSAPAREPGR